MQLNVAKEVAAMQRLTIGELRRRYAEAFGEQPTTKNRPWLVKRIAWRLQALAEGDLSERARQRAAELANDADLRTSTPRVAVAEPAPERTAVKAVRFQADERLPPPGSILTRRYKGEELRVQVLAEGFAFEGQVYASLSAVAKAITGSHCNGFLFFNLNRQGASR
jgi:hypothetical protein